MEIGLVPIVVEKYLRYDPPFISTVKLKAPANMTIRQLVGKMRARFKLLQMESLHFVLESGVPIQMSQNLGYVYDSNKNNESVLRFACLPESLFGCRPPQQKPIKSKFPGDEAIPFGAPVPFPEGIEMQFDGLFDASDWMDGEFGDVQQVIQLEYGSLIIIPFNPQPPPLSFSSHGGPSPIVFSSSPQSPPPSFQSYGGPPPINIPLSPQPSSLPTFQLYGSPISNFSEWDQESSASGLSLDVCFHSAGDPGSSLSSSDCCHPPTLPIPQAYNMSLPLPEWAYAENLGLPSISPINSVMGNSVHGPSPNSNISQEFLCPLHSGNLGSPSTEAPSQNAGNLESQPSRYSPQNVKTSTTRNHESSLSESSSDEESMDLYSPHPDPAIARFMALPPGNCEAECSSNSKVLQELIHFGQHGKLASPSTGDPSQNVNKSEFSSNPINLSRHPALQNPLTFMSVSPPLSGNVELPSSNVRNLGLPSISPIDLFMSTHATASAWNSGSSSSNSQPAPPRREDADDSDLPECLTQFMASELMDDDDTYPGESSGED